VVTISLRFHTFVKGKVAVTSQKTLRCTDCNNLYPLDLFAKLVNIESGSKT
jgi:hypothetical protein